MMDDQQLQAALYGAPAPAATPATASAASTDEVAGVLYTDASDRDRSDESLPDTDFPGDHPADPMYAAVGRDIERASVERFGLSQVEAQESSKAWSAVYRQFDVPPDDADTLTQVGISALANGVTPEQSQAWASDARAALRSEYGDRHEIVLADAMALIAQHPGLHAYLRQTGLGDHPKIVLAACRQAHRLRVQGKLK